MKTINNFKPLHPDHVDLMKRWISGQPVQAWEVEDIYCWSTDYYFNLKNYVLNMDRGE